MQAGGGPFTNSAVSSRDREGTADILGHKVLTLP